jgi:hypothetical protein
MAEEVTHREFEVELSSGDKKKFKTRAPTTAELQEGEFEYSKAFNRAIMAGIVPRNTLIAKLIENGVWSDEQDEAIEKKRLELVAFEEKFENADNAEKKQMKETLSDLRQELFQMRQERSSFVAHCAEAKADEAQRNFLVSKVTTDALTNRPVWKTLNDFLNEQDGQLVFMSTYEYMTFVNGLSSDFMGQLPENQIEEDEEEVQEDELPKAEPAEKSDDKADKKAASEA